MPQMTELSKPLKQLLSKTSEKTVVQKFIQQLLSEGQSINNISKEFGLPYNLVYEVAQCPGGSHGTRRDPGHYTKLGSQYQRRKAGYSVPKSH